MIGSVGCWVLREACTQVRSWHAAGLQALCIGVNVSVSQIHTEGFLGGVRSILCDTGFNHVTFFALKQLGLKLAIDNFGIGYLSLGYLRQFPIDALKINKSFVVGTVSGSDNGIIVPVVIGLGRNLKLGVVAEGVETQGWCEFLREHECGAEQGLYFSAPLLGEQFAALSKVGCLS